MKVLVTLRHSQSPWITDRIIHAGYISCVNGSRHFQKMKQPKAQIGFSYDNFDSTIITVCEFYKTKGKSFQDSIFTSVIASSIVLSNFWINKLSR